LIAVAAFAEVTGWPGRSRGVDVDAAAWLERSVVQVLPVVQPRKLAKVPFVELADGRLQGVVSSGSDIDRVYVSFIAANSHGYNCTTNNNRPCGGLGGRPCKHLDALLSEAVLQYGRDRVIRYLNVDVPAGGSIVQHLNGAHDRAPAATVFSRFLRHLAYLELPTSTEPVPELHWFPAKAVR
jgi:hypothetical protein